MEDAQDQADTEYGGGVCEIDNGNVLSSTQTRNYMQIDYYVAFTNSSDGCPAVVRASGSNDGFEYQATDYFATNICVEQDDGSYITYAYTRNIIDF